MLTLLWFSRDLRLTITQPWQPLIARGVPIVPVFVLDDLDAGEWAPGGAARWWLHGSLRALDESLRQRGNTLVLHRGSAETVINQVLEQNRRQRRVLEPPLRTLGDGQRRTPQDGRALSGFHPIFGSPKSDRRL